jgi:hypothetical protein
MTQQVNQKSHQKRKMKEYRQKLKETPDLYKVYLEAEAARNRAYRANLTDGQVLVADFFLSVVRSSPYVQPCVHHINDCAGKK